MELIAEDGIESFTLARLAEKTASAVGAVYRYFPSKEALLVALQRQILGSLHLELVAVLEDSQPPLTRLWSATRWYSNLPQTRPREMALVAIAVGSPRILLPGDEAAAVLEAAEPLFAALAELITEATKAGELEKGDARERAIELWAALHGVLQIQKLARVSPSLDAVSLAPALVRDLLRGWGAREDSLKSAMRSRRPR